MLTIGPNTQIYCAISPVDFRNGIDGLCGICKRELRLRNVFSGSAFVFCNKRRTSIKILIYDGQGFWLCQKRLSCGKLHYWPKVKKKNYSLLSKVALTLLTNNNDPNVAIATWKKLDKDV